MEHLPAPGCQQRGCLSHNLGFTPYGLPLANLHSPLYDLPLANLRSPLYGLPLSNLHSPFMAFPYRICIHPSWPCPIEFAFTPYGLPLSNFHSPLTASPYLEPLNLISPTLGITPYGLRLPICESFFMTSP